MKATAKPINPPYQIWYTDTPRVPICSDMRLVRKKPKKPHVKVLVVPVNSQ